METLHEIANLEYCTVICTIHQPQPKIFKLFDNLILMKDGNIIYQGDCSKCVPFFQKLGFDFDALSNPADQVIEFVKEYTTNNNIPTNEEEDSSTLLHTPNIAVEAEVDDQLIRSRSDTSRSRTNTLQGRARNASLDLGLLIINNDKPPLPSQLSCDELSNLEASEFLKELNNTRKPSLLEDKPTTTITNKPVNDIEMNNESFHLIMQGKIKPSSNLSLGSTKPPLTFIKKQPWLTQLIVLLKRSLHSNCKRYDILLMNLFVTILLAFFISSSVWYDIGTHKEGSSKRLASLFFCSVNQVYYSIIISIILYILYV